MFPVDFGVLVVLESHATMLTTPTVLLLMSPTRLVLSGLIDSLTLFRSADNPDTVSALALESKLLYRKVFFFNQSEVQTIGNSFNHNIVGIDEVVSCYGHAIFNAGDDFISRWLPFAYTLGTDSLPAWYGAVMAGKNTVKIQLGSSMLSYLTRLYIIIEYTKL